MDSSIMDPSIMDSSIMDPSIMDSSIMDSSVIVTFEESHKAPCVPPCLHPTDETIAFFTKYPTNIHDGILNLPIDGGSKENNKQRLTSSLTYAFQRLISAQHKPTPLGAKALLLYRDAIIEAQETPNEDTKRQLLVQIADFEDWNHGRALIQECGAPPEDFKLRIRHKLLEFKKVEFITKYRGYVSELARQLELEETEPPYASPMVVLDDEWWKKMSMALGLSARARATCPPEGGWEASAPTLKAVEIACRHIGLDTRDTIQKIHQLVRDRSFKNFQLNRMVENCDIESAARMARKDLEDLPKIFPPEEKSMESLFRLVIGAFLDAWSKIRAVPAEFESVDVDTAQGKLYVKRMWMERGWVKSEEEKDKLNAFFEMATMHFAKVRFREEGMEASADTMPEQRIVERGREWKRLRVLLYGDSLCYALGAVRLRVGGKR